MCKLNKETKLRFIMLSDRLEPENLYEDGEISGLEAEEKEIAIKTAWKILENAHHIKVTEKMCCKWRNQIQEETNEQGN